jgi:solute carrier family 25 phosphate transporter 23/24/25/41
MAPGESQDECDERVAKLWQSLGVRKDGRLDLNGLKKGLKKIDHREYYILHDLVLCWLRT